ncbi:hypothetical protein H6785_00785 [Candidatus Nomurabacteria bacterium]|nr:hypothetical protein [Candidatus Kaiserbacteria bacterium]MCB9815108.1 hypothetical protein [Candidatus Nomurabacteria bacterium]
MKYILDFDRTLLDTKTCYEFIDKDRIGGFATIPEVWEKYNSRDFLYEDVLSWLNTKDIKDLFILTASTPRYGSQASDYQKAKLQSGKFDELVNEIIFMEGLKGNSVAETVQQFSPDETVVFVDDKIEQCLSVKSACPNVFCCLMVRDSSARPEAEPLKDVFIVHSLKEVDAIIEAL